MGPRSIEYKMHPLYSMLQTYSKMLTNYIIGMRVDVFLEEDGLDRSVHNTNLTRKDMDKTPGSSQQELEQPAPPFPQQ